MGRVLTHMHVSTRLLLNYVLYFAPQVSSWMVVVITVERLVVILLPHRSVRVTALLQADENEKRRTGNQGLTQWNQLHEEQFTLGSRLSVLSEQKRRKSVYCSRDNHAGRCGLSLESPCVFSCKKQPAWC